jgi:hypothetical protein
MEKNENTTKVTISWIVLSCAALNVWMPIRLAGTWKQYSKKAIPQLMSVTFHSCTFWYFKWPYHAKVIKILERIKNTMVNIRGPYPIPRSAEDSSGVPHTRQMTAEQSPQVSGSVISRAQLGQ